MNPSSFLQAFSGTNTVIPVWFMRQAGRYLPEYRKIKGGHSLEEMFLNPELVAEITLLPVKKLGVDAAILFADILSLPAKMGFKIRFVDAQGPVIDTPIRNSRDLQTISEFTGMDDLAKAIHMTREGLPAGIALIGFAGSPFTVASYLLEGGSPTSFSRTWAFANAYPQAFHQLLQRLTDNTIRYLGLQKEAGIEAYQIFDTGSGVLRPSDYAHWSLPYVKKIFQSVKLPSIYYLKNASHLLKLMDQCGSDFLSVCQTVVFGHDPILAKNHHGVQGNLFNGLLYADRSKLKEEVLDCLLGARPYRRYIFNLSHGVFPDVDPDALKLIVDLVHGFDRKK